MKTRLSLMFVLAMGMALLLSWTVVGQRSEAKAIVLPAPPLDWGEGSSLGFTAPITFTPAYTVFLPVVMNRWPPPSQGISGRVTYRGNPIGGINVVLQRCTKT